MTSDEKKYWKTEKIAPSILALYITGPIGGGPETSRAILDVCIDDIAAIRNEIFGAGPLSEIHIMINSSGGSAVHADAIYGILKSHPAKKVVFIQGACGSAATQIAMAGDRIYMVSNGYFFIHQTHIIAYGGAADMYAAHLFLEEKEKKIRKLYSARTNLSIKKLKEMMIRETRLIASEALELGFIDIILPAIEDATIEEYSPSKELLDSKCVKCGYLFALENRLRQKDQVIMEDDKG
jgi:ATP-dependent protease ClpP protease subunit